MDRWLAFSLWILSRETEWLFAWFFTHYCHLWILQQQPMFLKPHFLSFPIFLFFFLFSPSFFHNFVFSISPLILFIQFLQIYDLVTASFSSPPSRLVFSCYLWFTQWLTSPALLLHYFVPFLSALILCDLTKNLYSRPHFYVLPASPSFSSFPHQQGFWSFARNSGGGGQQADSEEGGWCCQHHLHLWGQESARVQQEPNHHCCHWWVY